MQIAHEGTGLECATLIELPSPDRNISNAQISRYLVAKRLIDLTVSMILLVALFPLFAIIAILIFARDGGPVLFCQLRTGQNGRVFRFYKFRSMVVNAEAMKDKLAAQNEASGPIFKMKRDPRVTSVGRILRKYSLDELPQLVNVFLGDMSLVGPRPHLPREIAEYPEYPLMRLSVQPGLLCLREVQGRSNLTFAQWLESDLHYIRIRSLATDLSILLSVFRAVLLADGAY